MVEKPCIWISVYERARAANEIDRLRAFIPAPDRGLKGTSSWINYFLNRDVRPAACPALPVYCPVRSPRTMPIMNAGIESHRQKNQILFL